jgi:hypothetical protein
MTVNRSDGPPSDPATTSDRAHRAHFTVVGRSEEILA